jgi:small-conductance mechanosensitive channel
MVILSSLGVSVAPILATLGVGGLAVALALQDTLANLFAGVHISVNKLVRIGDYVKLESGDEGYVTDINWRTTAIKMPSNNMVLVPNSKLTQSIITNYYYPSKDMVFVVPVGVHYNSDLKKVERVTCEVAKEVMQQVPGGVPETAPCMRYHTLGDFSIQFNVVLRVREYTDQHLLRHEFIMRLQDRYAKEGIVIPYPVQAINTAQEEASGRA